MSEKADQSTDPAVYTPGNVLSRSNLGAVAAIGATLAIVAGVFAYTGGWLTPQRLTPGKVVEQLQRTNGLHAGFRRNHPKGVCFTGWFESNGAGARISKTTMFAPGRTPVFGRFAIAGGIPDAPDIPADIHSMAVNFALRDGEVWRMAINGMPVFVVRNVQEFTEQLAAGAPDSATGKPNPEKMMAFVSSHPATARAIGLLKATPLASGFANTTYNSLDAFLFTDLHGRTAPVRWSMVSVDPFEPAKLGPTAPRDPNYQFSDLLTRIAKGPIRWRFVVTLANPGDLTIDPTVPWPADRRQVDVGQLTIDKLEDEAHGACRDVTFDPLVLPAGVRGSDDPILSARSAAYAQSFRRRAGEPTPVIAVRFRTGTQGAH